MPVSLLAPVWEQFAALLPDRPLFAPTHPLGCHRRRVADRFVFEHVVAALVHGSGYERIASPGCSDRTIRRRLREWAEEGRAETLHRLILEQYDHLIGLELSDIAVDGCITKAPSGGEVAGRSPVDRGKQGLKRATLIEARGVPLHLVSAGANRPDAQLLEASSVGLTKLGPLPADITVHLDCGFARAATQSVLRTHGVQAVIAPKGEPTPIQRSPRWVVERTQAWMNGYGKLRRCTERRRVVVDSFLFLAAAFVVTRLLIEQARSRYRWPSRPTSRRLR